LAISVTDHSIIVDDVYRLDDWPTLSNPSWMERLLGHTFLNLCSDRRLSGRGWSGQVCGQFVHDTSPT
jgi:hypothetical protein